MSNTKASKTIIVKSTKSLVSIEQFNIAIADIKQHGIEAKASIKTAVLFMMQCTNYKDQQSAIKVIGAAYANLRKAIGDDVTAESAARWVKRTAKGYDEKFQLLKSDSEAAKKKAASRKANAAKSGSKAEPKKAEPKKAESTIVQLRNALVEKEIKLQADYRGVIPAGKVKEFDQAFAAFIQTIEMILK